MRRKGKRDNVELIKGQHPAIIEEDLRNRVQAIAPYYK